MRKMLQRYSCCGFICNLKNINRALESGRRGEGAAREGWPQPSARVPRGRPVRAAEGRSTARVEGWVQKMKRERATTLGGRAAKSLE